jgi:hypothetical protein
MMEEDKEKHLDSEKSEKQEIFSKSVRAGKRTYFFDVKSTRRDDYYLTITESKKRYNKDGRYFYEKHKLFLYKEDFEKFLEGLNDTIGFIQGEQPEKLTQTPDQPTADEPVQSYTDVEFEDLESVEANPEQDNTESA